MRTPGLILCATLIAVPSAALGQADSGAEAAIKEGAIAWQTGWNSGDGAALAEMYVADAIVMPPGGDALEGREAIQAGLQAAIDQAGGSQLAIKPGEVMASGDLAIEVGTFVETAADGSHADHGKYVAVWKNVDGSWKIVRDIWNSSMP